MKNSTAKAVRTYGEGTPVLRTSYRNQQLLAARDLGGNTECLHGEALEHGCFICRTSGCVLLPAS